MTIQEALTQCDALKPNQYSQNDKIRWLSTLDWMVKIEIMDKYEGHLDIVFEGYNEDTCTDTILLIAEPYSDIYIKYLFSQIDFNNAEFARYNNSVVMFNSAYMTFQNYYNRTNMPINMNWFRV